MKILIGIMILSATCQSCGSERVASSSQGNSQQGEKPASNTDKSTDGANDDRRSGEEHYGQANFLKGGWESEEALKEYHLAIQEGYDTVELRIQLGLLLRDQLNRREEAIEQFRTAVQREPDNWRAHWPLAQALLATKQYDNALREIEVSDNLDPEGHADGFYTFYRAKSFDGLERYREALGEYESFLKHYGDISPRDPDVVEAGERITAIRKILNRD